MGKKPTYKEIESKIKKLEREISKHKKGMELVQINNFYLAALHKTALDFMGRLELRDLLKALVAGAAALVGTSDGYVDLYDSKTQELEVRVGLGYFAKDVGYRLKTGEGLAGRVWKTGKFMSVRDYNKWSGKVPGDRFKDLKAMAGIPIRLQGKIVGVIGLGNTNSASDNEFGKQQKAILEQYSKLASIALDNANLYSKLQQELNERKRVEGVLKGRESELKIQTKNLEEANIALKVLLNKRDEDKQEFERRIFLNIKHLIFPGLERLQQASVTEYQKVIFQILKSNLMEIISPFAHKMTFTNLTPTEIQIANLIRFGKTSKEIANSLNLCKETIDCHRKHIRRKVGITKKKINMRTYLSTIDDGVKHSAIIA